MITLTLLHPNQATPLQHWTFDEESVIRIGRATDSNVVLYSVVVSRRHVEIRRNGSEWELENLGANGTLMNDQHISKVPVVDGMVIRLATTGPRIQICIISDDLTPRLSIERLDSDTNGLKSPDKETIA